MNVLDLLSERNSRTPLAYRRKACGNKHNPANAETFAEIYIGCAGDGRLLQSLPNMELEKEPVVADGALVI